MSITAIRVIRPPEFPLDDLSGKLKIFLAGSIEMGKAEMWQERVITEIGLICAASVHTSNLANQIVIFNPRRDDWDSSWVQKIDDPQFNLQVNWEMDHLERADKIIFYFAPNTLSPISLLEFGTFWGKPGVYICAHPDYPRRGNLEVFCHRKELVLYNNTLDLLRKLIRT